MKSIKIFIIVLVFSNVMFAQKYLIKFASVAPDGSTWMNIMKEYDAQIRKESNGQMGFKIYGGGVAGDEKDVIRKIKLGQYHSAGFTGVGMGEISKKVRILDAPFLFKKDYNEVDYFYNAYWKELSDALLGNDFILLGWAEVGFVYVFTNVPVNSVNDLKRVKMWVWQGDPVAESAFKTIGITPIPLSLSDVYTSLQTGLINAFYTSPLAGVSLQWYTKAKYILDVPLANSAGSVLIYKKEWDKLPQDMQKILLDNGHKYMRKLTEASRRDNDRSLKIMQEKGLTLTKASAKATEEYQNIGKESRKSLATYLFRKICSIELKRLYLNIEKGKSKMNIIKKIEDLLIKFEISILVLMLSIMVLLAFLQVVLRNIFSTGFLWADTFLRYLVVWVGFLGASIAAKEEKHINIDALSRFLKPSVKNFASILTNGVAAVVCYYMFTASIQFINIGIPDGTTLFNNIPILYFMIIIPAGFILMALHFGLRVVFKIGQAFHNSQISGGKA